MKTLNLKPEFLIFGAVAVGALWFMHRRAQAQGVTPIYTSGQGVAGTQPSTGGIGQLLGGVLSGLIRPSTTQQQTPAQRAVIADQWSTAAQGINREAMQAYYGTGADPTQGGSGDPYNDGTQYASNRAPNSGQSFDYDAYYNSGDWL